MPKAQRTVQICLFLVAAISLFGGTLQMLMGLPEPAGVWIGYLVVELVFPVIIVAAHWATQRGSLVNGLERH